MPRRQKGVRSQQNNLRIIAGRWRSRKIDFAGSTEIRPTPDRVRETLFNWLGPDIIDARCLDLFAGSGILAIESLSRGAASATLVDHDPAVIHHIRSTLSGLDALEASTLHTCTATAFLTQTPLVPFDIVFLDPPFRDCQGHSVEDNLLLSTLTTLTGHAVLATASRVYTESPHDLSALPLPSSWRILRNKKAGDVHYALLHYSP